MRVCNKLAWAKFILKSNFGSLDLELMLDYLTEFNKTPAGERYVARFNTYLLQEGMSQTEANLLIIKSLGLEQGPIGSACWN